MAPKGERKTQTEGQSEDQRPGFVRCVFSAVLLNSADSE